MDSLHGSKTIAGCSAYLGKIPTEVKRRVRQGESENALRASAHSGGEIEWNGRHRIDGGKRARGLLADGSEEPPDVELRVRREKASDDRFRGPVCGGERELFEERPADGVKGCEPGERCAIQVGEGPAGIDAVRARGQGVDGI